MLPLCRSESSHKKIKLFLSMKLEKITVWKSCQMFAILLSIFDGYRVYVINSEDTFKKKTG